MLSPAAKHLQYMKQCLEDAECLSGAERDWLLYMANGFERGAVQIERSMRLIAESKAALAFAENVLAGNPPPPRPSTSLGDAEAAGMPPSPEIEAEKTQAA